MSTQEKKERDESKDKKKLLKRARLCEICGGPCVLFQHETA